MNLAKLGHCFKNIFHCSLFPMNFQSSQCLYQHEECQCSSLLVFTAWSGIFVYVWRLPEYYPLHNLLCFCKSDKTLVSCKVNPHPDMALHGHCVMVNFLSVEIRCLLWNIELTVVRSLAIIAYIPSTLLESSASLTVKLCHRLEFGTGSLHLFFIGTLTSFYTIISA